MMKSTMRDTIAVKPITGEGPYGPIEGTSQSIPAYVEPGFRQVVNRQGQETVASLFCIVASDATINAGDIATFGGRTYEVIDVQQIRPGGRVDHLEVYLKSVG